MRYVQATFWVAAALALALGLAPYLPYPFLFPFLAAVMVSAWFGGIGPGLYAVILSSAVVDYYFIPPLHHLAISPSELPYLLAFVISAVLAAWLSAARRGAEASLRQARDDLERRVEERTVELQRTNEALRATQAELAHATRVMTMGEIVVSVAHELSQPLVGVLTNAGAALRWLEHVPPRSSEARGALERILRDGNRAGEVLAQVRALIRKAQPKKVELDLHGAIQDVVTVLESELRRARIALRFEPAPNLPPVTVDRVQLQQVVLNLLVNAIDALRDAPEGSRHVRIGTSRVGDEISVAIEDSGSGIPEPDRERIFEPFFTTKGEGLGLGLSISRSIVEAHGGRLWAESRRDGGATLCFTFPIAR